MRRELSISLILMLWLGPLASLLPASDESRLPVCCRAQGAHRCSLAAHRAANSAPAFTPQSRCARFPVLSQAVTGPTLAHIEVADHRAHVGLERFTQAIIRPAARSHFLRISADRGPPASLQA